MNEIKIEGLEDLNKALEELKNSVSDGEQDSIVKSAAEKVKSTVEPGIPMGPTGNLRKSLVLRKMSSPGTYVVAMDRKIAPHAHLVEYGHAGGASANPFFRPAVDSALPQAAKAIEEEIKRRVR